MHNLIINGQPVLVVVHKVVCYVWHYYNYNESLNKI